MASVTRFIVGIDLGTTYSAAAWALTTSPKNIEVIKKWPTAGQLVGSKVPTEIAYGDDRSITWGYDINPRSRKIRWFKLALETESSVMSLPDGMSIVDVTRDYLRALNGHIMMILGKQYSASLLREAHIDFVITVPAIWSDMAKKRTEVAANAAGLGGTETTTLTLQSEPESAAVHTLKTVENFVSRLKVNDKIVVCDAGGGTVDLISYQIKQLEPLLQLEECTSGTGDFCGSSFIDREFEKLVTQRMGATYESISIMHRQQILKSFEQSKMAFRDDSSQASFYIHMPTTASWPEAGIYDHQLELSREEMRYLFDPIVNKILALIQEQVSMASNNTNSIRAILLVGGFGESDYLFSRVKAYASPFGTEVLQPNDASTAVVQGAVLKGLEARAGSTIRLARRARRSYGVPTREKFIEGRHQEIDAEIDPNAGIKMANNQVRWFIRENQVVDDREEFRFRFRRTFKYLTEWEDCLVTSPSPNPPDRMELGVQRHCTIRSNLTHLDVRKYFPKERRGLTSYYTADYEIVVGLRDNNLNLSLLYRGVRYGVADVQFEMQNQ